jgi:glycine betaine/proline transport system substrate-binding protein
MAFEVSVQKRDPAEVAREWMSNNKSTVDGWLGL